MCSSPRFREEDTDTRRDPFWQRLEGHSNRDPGIGGQTWADPGLSYCVNLAVPVCWITKCQTRNLKSIALPSPQVAAFLEWKETHTNKKGSLEVISGSPTFPVLPLLNDIAPNPADHPQSS